MATAVFEPQESRLDKYFFPGMALLMLATVFFGFARSYFLARVFRAPLCRRAHVRRVSKHFRQRNDRLDHLRSRTVLHTFNPPAPRTQIAHDRSGIIFRCHHLYRHHRLQ